MYATVRITGRSIPKAGILGWKLNARSRDLPGRVGGKITRFLETGGSVIIAAFLARLFVVRNTHG